MATYLERYLAGEYERVWDELQALGAAVREEPLHADARAVARETMRRVRHNIQALIPRLEERGYAFGYRWLMPEQADFAAANPPVYGPAKGDAAARIDEFERLAGMFPLSLRAFYEQVGTVNFVGVPPDHWPPGQEADPLYVHPVEVALEAYAEWLRETEYYAARPGIGPGPFRVPIAPDSYHKYNISGGMWYNIVLPSPAADASLEDEPYRTTFVNYLRTCFRWGGFPGLGRAPRPPANDLAWLTRELLPL
jgi:hypothetical protein